MSGGWPALEVAAWTPTRETLHMWLQILGKQRMAAAPMLNHWWHSTLTVTARGLTTGPLAAGGEVVDIELDLIAHRITIRSSTGDQEDFSVLGLSVADFYARIVSAQKDFDLPRLSHPAPNEVAHAIPFAEDREHNTYDPAQAHTFWRQLLIADRLLRQLRSGFRGKASPVHFFWGAMDLATTRFSGRPAPQHPGGAPNCPDRVMYEGYSEELSSAGFWPGGGQEGAFYSYAYPPPEGFASAPAPEGSFWDDGLAEFLLPWETARQSIDPDGLASQFLDATAQAAMDLAQWPDRSGVAAY